MSAGRRLFLSSPHMSEEGYELRYIQEAFDTNWIAPLGNNVNQFEKELCEKIGAKCAAALNAGTAAVHMALKAAGVGKGDIVFCQSLTFAATANPIVYQNAIPVFIDSEEETWNMSPEALETAFERFPNAKAVIAVHLYGFAAKMERIMELCRAHGAVLIEDAAESLGTKYGGAYTGTFGDYSVFSFNGNKIITSSGGGMLVCNLEDAAAAEERIGKVRFWSTQARDPARHYQHSELGYNYRMSNIVAGIGRGQLQVLDRRVEKKRYLFNCYKSALDGLPGVSMMPESDRCESNRWLTCIRLREAGKPLALMLALERENIESRPIWKPMHLQPFYQNCAFVGSGVSDRIYETGVCLPSDTKMTDEDLDHVIELVKQACGS